jgi:dipeptidase E
MVAGQFLDQPLIDMIYSQEPAPVTGQQHPLGFYSFAFVPHLNNTEWFPHVRVENLERLKGQFTYPVRSTDDETALTVIDGTVTVVGEGAHWESQPS